MRAEQVGNPAYTSWAKFKPRTTITFSTVDETTTLTGVVGTEAVTTTKLVEVKPDFVMLEGTYADSIR